MLDDDDWRTNLYNDDWELYTLSDLDIVAGKACIATISFLSEDADFGQRQQIPEIKIDRVWHGAHVEARVEQ